MPTPSYRNRWLGKPQPVRKENDWTPWTTTHQRRMAQIAPAHLMTPQEVKDRLAAGEDPLLLSIEHWVQNAAWIKEHGSLPSGSSTVTTCALCRLHRPSVTISPQTCPTCPLGISQGRACDARSKPATAWRQFFFDPSYANAMNMVAVLASLKPPESAIPQFYIDGEGEGKVALRLEQGSDGNIDLRATKKGDSYGYYLLEIRQDGSVRLTGSVRADLGFNLDDAGRLRLQRE